jgi:uncharacterized protein with NAD-binding domain and iron-sulfur cluster
MTKKVVVLGAGIAGLVTAYELADRGMDVTVLEAAPFPGGRTSTWVDERGRTVDTGLHVVADHYVNLIDVLTRLGATRKLRWVEKHTYLQPSRDPLEWYFTQARPPFHFIRPMREMPVKLLHRLALIRTSFEMAAYAQEDLAELDDVRYLDWHHEHRLGDGFLLDLAEAACDAATFLTIDVAAARPVLSWMKYLMRHRRAGDVGIFDTTLEEGMIGPLVRAIEARGGKIRTSTAVVGFEVEGKRVRAVRVQRATHGGPCHAASGAVKLADAPEERVVADVVVSAMPIQAFQRVVGKELARDMGVEACLGLTTTPAISLIVWFDRKIEPVPQGAPLVTGCAMRDFIDMETMGRAPKDAPGSVYQFVVTRAEERMAHSDAEVARDCVADLKKVWPGARSAEVVDFAVERVGAAMFAAIPGAHAKRPTTRTAFGNFFLAGDWIRHDLNASMEGAALSGRLAADAVLADAGGARLLVRRPPDPNVWGPLRKVRRTLLRRGA